MSKEKMPSIEAISRQKLLCKAVDWIAHNDDNGAPHAMDENEVRGMISVLLVADLFEISGEEVAEMVVGARRRSMQKGSF
jgi:hypothetical protein